MAFFHSYSSEIPTSKFSMGMEHNGKGLKSSSIHCFWDTLLHFLKTYFSWENGFLLFLELHQSLLVRFQGCKTQWQWFENSSSHCFWDTPKAFSQNTFLLRKWLSFIPRAQKIPTSMFSGCRTQWQRFGSTSIHHFCDTLLHFLKSCFSWESAFFSS